MQTSLSPADVSMSVAKISDIGIVIRRERESGKKAIPFINIMVSCNYHYRVVVEFFVLLQINALCPRALPSYMQVCATELPCRNISIDLPASDQSHMYREIIAYPLPLHKHIMLKISICNIASSCWAFHEKLSE